MLCTPAPAIALSTEVASLIGFISAVVIITIGIIKFGKGLDKNWSVSNVQLILWTGVILGSYFALALAKGEPLDNLPYNTLILIGIASGTTPFAALIRHGQQPQLAAPPDSPAGFLASEKNPEQTSVAKMQMFAWNIIAMILFIIGVSSNMSNCILELPDLGQLLTYIVGISNGIYLANKTADKPT
jgi:hypothetical protein